MPHFFGVHLDKVTLQQYHRQSHDKKAHQKRAEGRYCHSKGKTLHKFLKINLGYTRGEIYMRSTFTSLYSTTKLSSGFRSRGQRGRSMSALRVCTRPRHESEEHEKARRDVYLEQMASTLFVRDPALHLACHVPPAHMAHVRASTSTAARVHGCPNQLTGLPKVTLRSS